MKGNRIGINCDITKPRNSGGPRAPSVTWVFQLRPPEAVLTSRAWFGGRTAQAGSGTCSLLGPYLGCTEVVRLWGLFHMKEGSANFEFKLEKGSLGAYLPN